MKNKFFIYIIALIILVSTNVYAESQDLQILLNNINNNYDIPDISGPVDNLPWRNDSDFLKAKEKYKTPLLMAGFCAVLKNPLPGEEYNVNLAAKKIKGEILKPSSTFSQNFAIGPYTNSRGYKDGASYIGGNIIMTEGGGVCKIATTLYNLAVLSNLEIVERHNHSMSINYVPYGQDATVAYGIKDFKFKGNKDSPILIWSQLIDNRLYMAFYGRVKPPAVEWSHEIKETVPPSVKYIKNENLKPGEMVTTINGMDGATVKSNITIIKNDGSVTIKNMGISHYFPLPKVIEIN